MYLTTIAGGSGNTYHDVQGNTLILTGNDRLWPGRQVWTVGHYIFSFSQQADVPPNKPVISEDNLIFPYLTASGQYPNKMIYNFFTKDSSFSSRSVRLSIICSFCSNVRRCARCRVRDSRSVFNIAFDLESLTSPFSFSTLIKSSINYPAQF